MSFGEQGSGFQNQLVAALAAGNTIINSNGIFAYNGTPAAGNLLLSETGVAGTDPFGNKYLAGNTSYNGATAVNTGGTGLTYYTNSSGQSGTWTSQGSVAFRNASSPQLVLPSGFTGTIPASQSDSTTFNATTTSLTQLSKAWDVPANDAAANTIYRLTVWGNGVQGSTADNASWAVHVGSTSVISLGIAGAVWTASVTANFRLVVELQCTAAGSSGNFNADGEWLLTDNSTAAALYAAALVDNTNTVNTTIDNKIEFFWQWAAVTGSPAIHSFGSILERISG